MGRFWNGGTSANLDYAASGVHSIGQSGTADYGATHIELGNGFVLQCGVFNSCVNATTPSYVTNYSGSCTHITLPKGLKRLHGVYACPADSLNHNGSWEAFVSGDRPAVAANGAAEATSSTSHSGTLDDDSGAVTDGIVFRYTVNNSYATANSRNGIGNVYWMAWGLDA
jgi:hypothetical protein